MKRAYLYVMQVMGAGFNVIHQFSDGNGGARRYENGVTWHGPANALEGGVPQDDLAVIDRKLSRLTQPTGATTAAAAPVCTTPPAPWGSLCVHAGGRTRATIQSAVTMNPAASQVFSFSAQAGDSLGAVTLVTVTPIRLDWAWWGQTATPLNVDLAILDSTGAVHASDDKPAKINGDGQGAAIAANTVIFAAAGTYYIRVTATGELGKYPAYGSFGEFTLTADLPSQQAPPIANDDLGAVESVSGNSVSIPVLDNDIGTGLVVTAVTQPAPNTGTASFNANSVSYQAPAGAEGTVSEMAASGY